MSVELEAAINPNAVFGYPSIRELSPEDERAAEVRAAEFMLEIMYSGEPLQDRYALLFSCVDRTFRRQAVYRFMVHPALTEQ